VKNTIDVDTNPLDAVVVDNFLYVLNGGVNHITLINLILGKIDGSINVSSNLRNALFSKQFNRVYLAHYDTRQISFLIPFSRIITRTTDTGFKPIGLAIDETRNSLYLAGHDSNKIVVIDPISEMVKKIITVGKNPYGIVSIK
jgi:YVTN family beta-propeller protein